MRINLYNDLDLCATYTEDPSPCPENFAMHAHFQAELFYFISGDAVYHVEGTEYELQPGDILLMRPAEAHYIELRSQEAYKRIVISFDAELFASLDPKDQLMRPYFNRDSGKHNLYRKSDFQDCDPDSLFRLLYDQRDSRSGSIAALMLLLTAIGRVFDAAPPKHAQANTLESRMLRYINAHLGENISLEKMAQYYFISRAQLCRFFNAYSSSHTSSSVSLEPRPPSRSRSLRMRAMPALYSVESSGMKWNSGVRRILMRPFISLRI